MTNIETVNNNQVQDATQLSKRESLYLFYKLIMESKSCKDCISLGSLTKMYEQIIEDNNDLTILNELFEKTKKTSSETHIFTCTDFEGKWKIDQDDHSELELLNKFDKAYNILDFERLSKNPTDHLPPSRLLFDNSDLNHKKTNEYMFFLPLVIDSNTVFFDMVDERFDHIIRQKVSVGKLLFCKIDAVYRFINVHYTLEVDSKQSIFIKWTGTVIPHFCQGTHLNLEVSDKIVCKKIKGWNLVKKSRLTISPHLTNTQILEYKLLFEKHQNIQIQDFFKSNFANILHEVLDSSHESEWMAVFFPKYEHEEDTKENESNINDDYSHMARYRFIPENYTIISDHKNYVDLIHSKQQFAYSFKQISLLDIEKNTYNNCVLYFIFEWCRSNEFKSFLQRCVGVSSDLKLNEAFCSWYCENDFLSPHTDQPNGDLAFIIQLSKDWDKNNGGCLELYQDNNSAKLEKVVIPVFNSLTLFKVPKDGGKLHSVNRVRNSGKNRRLAITGWFSYIQTENS